MGVLRGFQTAQKLDMVHQFTASPFAPSPVFVAQESFAEFFCSRRFEVKTEATGYPQGYDDKVSHPVALRPVLDHVIIPVDIPYRKRS